MSTSSQTIVLDEENNEILNLASQSDGYPEKPGQGWELARFLNRFKIINGISSYDPRIKQANGMNCLAAQIVAHFKRPHRKIVSKADGRVILPARGPVGGYYMQCFGDRDFGEYLYFVTMKGDKLNITVSNTFHKEVLFDGSPKAMLQWLRKYSKCEQS